MKICGLLADYYKLKFLIHMSQMISDSSRIGSLPDIFWDPGLKGQPLSEAHESLSEIHRGHTRAHGGQKSLPAVLY